MAPSIVYSTTCPKSPFQMLECLFIIIPNHGNSLSSSNCRRRYKLWSHFMLSFHLFIYQQKRLRINKYILNILWNKTYFYSLFVMFYIGFRQTCSNFFFSNLPVLTLYLYLSLISLCNSL